MMDDLFSKEYAEFIMPPAEVLEEERYIASLSDIERQLYFTREDYINGKISHDSYQDMVGMILLYDGENLSKEEYRRLENRYAA